MAVDAYASKPHYAAHIAPVWVELERRGLAGTWWGTSRGDPDRPRLTPAREPQPCLVAAYHDAQRVRVGPLILIEHGAGQTYAGDPRMAAHPSYSGGRDWERCVLFVCPSETVADRWRAAYPDTPAVAVGCPRLDPHHARTRVDTRVSEPPTVAVTFHWNWQSLPETRTAWRHYDEALPALCASSAWRILGTGHPRMWSRLQKRWEQLGVDHTPDPDRVLAEADLLVGDNTSLLPEFASLGKPVVWLDAPWFRRDVDHGGRFWDWPRGQVTCAEPEWLVDAVAVGLSDPPQVQAARERMLAEVYAHRDGQAAVRAADAIEETLATSRTMTMRKGAG